MIVFVEKNRVVVLFNFFSSNKFGFQKKSVVAFGFGEKSVVVFGFWKNRKENAFNHFENIVFWYKKQF